MKSIIKKYNPGGVDREVLRRTGKGGFISDGYLREEPIETSLESDENVVFVRSNGSSGVEYKHGEREEPTDIRPGDGYRAFAVVTDSRLLFIIGDNDGGGEEGDCSVSIPLADLAVVEGESGLFTGTLGVVTSSGMRWEFACSESLDPVVGYLNAASTTWVQVETHLEDGRKHLVEATGQLESGDYDDAIAAVRDAMAEADAARHRERQFCEGGVPAIDSRIKRFEDRIRDVHLRVLRGRATRRIDTAETHWRENAYDAAYRSYSDAHGDYQEILSRVESDAGGTDADPAQLREKLAQIEDNMSYLEQAPIDDAETAEDRAEAADTPRDRARYLERALDRYRTALELDWGEDFKRFEYDTESVRERIDDTATDLIAARREQATQQMQAADDCYATERYREAREHYHDAREALRAAHDVARELVPGSAGEVNERLAAVDERLDEIEDRLEAPPAETDPQDVLQ